MSVTMMMRSRLCRRRVSRDRCGSRVMRIGRTEWGSAPFFFFYFSGEILYMPRMGCLCMLVCSAFPCFLLSNVKCKACVDTNSKFELGHLGLLEMRSPVSSCEIACSYCNILCHYSTMCFELFSLWCRLYPATYILYSMPVFKGSFVVSRWIVGVKRRGS